MPTCTYILTVGPEYSKEEWMSVKFTLGLDFPNVRLLPIMKSFIGGNFVFVDHASVFACPPNPHSFPQCVT